MDVLENSQIEMTMDHIFRSGIIPAMKSTIKAYEEGNLSLNETLSQIRLDLDAVDKYFEDPIEISNESDKHKINIMIREAEEIEDTNELKIIAHKFFEENNNITTDNYKIIDTGLDSLIYANICRENLSKGDNKDV